MFKFNSLKELIKTLNRDKDLLAEMFQKRKSFAYKYEQATEIIEENKIEDLIKRGIIRKSGKYIEIDDHFLQFFEQILDVNEEINTAYINENIQQLKQNINYYLQENNQNRKYTYLKAVKSTLRKIGRITIKNIIDLKRNIENTVETEPTYKIKINKLQNYDQKRADITHLITQTRTLLKDDEITFFKTALDEELKQITIQLHKQLQDAQHNLIEMERQIINFLNRIKYQNEVLEKIKQIKYLKDQFEINSKTNINHVLLNHNALFFEVKPTYPLKLSLDRLQDDDVYKHILKINRQKKFNIKPQLPVAGEISEEYLQTEIENEISINIEEIGNGFFASGKHLFDFVMTYQYPKDLSFEEKLIIYCQLISIYETKITLTGQYNHYKNIEYAIIYPS